MGKKRRTKISRDIPISSIAEALHELNITSFKKSNRREKLGMICTQMGRKDSAENRLAINYLLKKNAGCDLDKRSPKRKYKSSEYAHIYKVRRKRISLKQSSLLRNPGTRVSRNTAGLISRQRLKSAPSRANIRKSIKKSVKRRMFQRHSRGNNRNDSMHNQFSMTETSPIDLQKQSTVYSSDSSSDDTILYEYSPHIKIVETSDMENRDLRVFNGSIFEDNMDQFNSPTARTPDSACGEIRNRDTEDMPLLKTCPISAEVIEDVFDVPLQGKFFTRHMSQHHTFSIDESEWNSLMASAEKRSLKRGTWHQVMTKGLARINPYCSFMIRRHYVNDAKYKIRRRGSRLFTAQLYCSFQDCTMTCRLEMYKETEVQCTFNGNLKQDITEQQARPIAGTERDEIKKDFNYGIKPYRLYLKRFKEIPDDVKIAGNMSHVGSSPNVLRRIASEAKRVGAMDPDDWISVCKTADQMITNSENKVVNGFIQQISIRPSFIMYWNDAGLRLWHHLANDNVAFWDATGSVISAPDKKRYLYYELALANPTTGEPSIPVTSMLTTSHDTPQVQYWISKFRLQEKKLFGHSNISKPAQVNSDRSLVFINSILSEFSNENLDEFRKRAWNIISGNFKEEDIKKTIPHVCLAHTMKNIRDLCKLHYKSNFEYGMYVLSLLVNVSDLESATKCLQAIFTVLLSRNITDTVESAANYIDSQIKVLPEISSTDDDDTIDEVEHWLKSADVNPNLYSEEDYTIRKRSNEFSSWAVNIRSNIESQIVTSQEVPITNKRYSADLADNFVKNFISFFPIWSNILLGDLTRHSKQRPDETPSVKQLKRKTNAVIEQRFRVLKDIAFGGEKKSRLDIFSIELQEHVETVQKLAVLRNLKTRPKPLKRASKIIEEGWMKKGKVNKDTGKYQKAPTKLVETFSSDMSSPKGRAVRVPSENIKPNSQKLNASVKLTTTHTHDDQNIDDMLTKQAENARNKKGLQEQPSYSHSRAAPSAYRSKEMITDLAQKQFTSDCICTNVSTTLALSKCLNEIYMSKAKSSLSSDLLERYTDSHSGLENLGASCWFNAVVQLFCNSTFMQNIYENFVSDLSFEPQLRNVLNVFHRAALGREVQRGNLQSALLNLQERYNININRQNDAHEFISTVLFPLMSFSGATSLIKMTEAIGCGNCSYRSVNEFDHKDIQLRVPSTEIKESAKITDLLDEYFSGEHIQTSTPDRQLVEITADDNDLIEERQFEKKSSGKCCDNPSLWKHAIAKQFPPDLVITLSRYEYKNNRMGKSRKPIIIDKIINIGRYTEKSQEIIYRLKGMVIHRGGTPTSGHYTFVDEDGPRQVVINDNRISYYYGNDHFTDSYIILYEIVPANAAVLAAMPKIVTALSVVTGLTLGIERYLPEEMISTRKNKLIELLEDVDVIDGEVINVHRLCTLLQDGIAFCRLPMTTTASLLSNTVKYIFGESNDVIRQSIGVSFMKVHKCSTCTFLNVQECHEVLYTPKIDTNIKCTVCKTNTVEESYVITHFGHTIILPNLTNFTKDKILYNTLMSSHFFQKVECLEIKWRAYLSSTRQLIINKSNSSSKDIYQLMTESGKIERVEESVLHNILLHEPNDDSNPHFIFIDVRKFCFETNSVMSVPSLGDDWEDVTFSLSREEIDLCNHFDIAMTVGNIQLSTLEVSRFMRSEFSDANIDAYYQTLNSEHQRKLLMPAAWYGSRLDRSAVNTSYTSTTWFDKEMVFIPVNIEGKHWILIAVDPSLNTVFYLDPLGGNCNQPVINRIISFLHFQFYKENGYIMTFEIKICNLIQSGLFQVQNDETSCGAYVCLYTMMIASGVYHKKTKLTGKNVRQIIFNAVLIKFYSNPDLQEYGLKDVIKTVDLNEIVHDICTGSQLRNDRHEQFLKDPFTIKGKDLTGFAENYFPTPDDRLLINHLLTRYFRNEVGMFHITKTSIFRDAVELNEFTIQNMNYAKWYVECVLVKDVLTMLLSRQLKLDR